MFALVFSWNPEDNCSCGSSTWLADAWSRTSTDGRARAVCTGKPARSSPERCPILGDFNLEFIRVPTHLQPKVSFRTWALEVRFQNWQRTNDSEKQEQIKTIRKGKGFLILVEKLSWSQGERRPTAGMQTHERPGHKNDHGLCTVQSYLLTEMRVLILGKWALQYRGLPPFGKPYSFLLTKSRP